MTGTRCAACGTDREIGELLIVRDLAGVRADAYLCRSSVSDLCTAWAGTADQTSIALADPSAARELDRIRGGEDRLARAAEEARDANARRSLAYG